MFVEEWNKKKLVVRRSKDISSIIYHNLNSSEKVQLLHLKQERHLEGYGEVMVIMIMIADDDDDVDDDDEKEEEGG